MLSHAIMFQNRERLLTTIRIIAYIQHNRLWWRPQNGLPLSCREGAANHFQKAPIAREAVAAAACSVRFVSSRCWFGLIRSVHLLTHWLSQGWIKRGQRVQLKTTSGRKRLNILGAYSPTSKT